MHWGAALYSAGVQAKGADAVTAILEVQNAAFKYNRNRFIFSNISFSLEPGRILSIIGPNGCGKSTLLNCLAGLVKLSQGEVLLDGKPQVSYNAKEIAKIVGYVPQFYTLSYGYTLRDYVVMGYAPRLGILATPGKEECELADEAMKRMGIFDLAEQPITEMSGGERQQAVIARVLVQKPRIIMMDEPASALDYGNQNRVLRLVKELADEGFAVIMTTHTPDHAIMLDDTVALLDRQGNMSIGYAKEIRREDILKQVYRTNLKMVHIAEAGRMACIALME
jgi:iron complex transport system ATP-binding protein